MSSLLVRICLTIIYIMKKVKQIGFEQPSDKQVKKTAKKTTKKKVGRPKNVIVQVPEKKKSFFDKLCEFFKNLLG